MLDRFIPPEPSTKFASPTPEQVGQAAGLSFLDVESDEQIAAQLGISRRTLARWRARPEYITARVAVETAVGHILTVLERERGSRREAFLYALAARIPGRAPQWGRWRE